MKTQIKQISSWKYRTIGVAMDGGTLSLIFTNTQDEEIEVHLGQHVNEEYYPELSVPPARICINGQIIDKRSKTEDSLIELLEKMIEDEIIKNGRELIIEKLDFIKSDAYLSFKPIKLELSEKRKKYLESLKANPNQLT